jgi:diaminohydroxyphosphoribosylaminopyrimidine deaminase / 5-amino-6-(5-phosphoribosylamino)uracil reductase
MELALDLARRGWGRVHPNPLVGCVLVRDGVLVGEGWHREWGGAHAEANALRQAGEAARGAVAYVSLEPCRHQGKTPPCTDALVQAGIRRVVFGAADPGKRSGGGASLLRLAGVEVTGPVLGPEEARRENPVFFHRFPDRPWTVLKLALSLDGGIAPAEGRRTRLTGEEASAEVHRLRAGMDGILVGTRTAEVDDPLLTVRGPVVPRVPPARIVLDLRGRLGPGMRLLREGDAPVWVLTGSDAPKEWRERMEAAGARIVVAETGGAGRPSPEGFLRTLRAEGIRALLCEGGGRLGTALLGAGAVDRLVHVLAPRFLGAGAVPGYPGTPDAGARDGMNDAVGTDPWMPASVRRLGDDLWLEWDRLGKGALSPGEGSPATVGEEA